MHTPSNGRVHDRRVSANADGVRRIYLDGLKAGVMAALVAVSGAAFAQERAPHAAGSPPSKEATEAPRGLPAPNWPSSPHRGVIDGWTGKPIPCRCRFNGKAYPLGEIVCMTTHVGAVLTRCDMIGNNTSWMPSRQPCTPDAGI